MTRDLMLSLLRRGSNGTQILEILETIVDDVTDANIEDCAQYFAKISAPTSAPIAF